MIRHIVVIDSKQGVAKDGDQPIHLAGDQQYFRNQTTDISGNILMGRTTYEVIGILKNRQNFIATRQPELIKGVTLVADVTDFLKQFEQDIWVIGGAAIFEQTLPLADELYITEVDADLHCDQFYPSFRNQFELVSASDIQTDDGLNYRFCIYKKSK